MSRPRRPEAPCSIDGCDAIEAARGWCPKHYMRWRRTGSPDGLRTVWSGRKRIPFEERFWSKVDIRGPGECWEWQASRKPDGYGSFQRRTGQRAGAHRVAYELAVGPIPDGFDVCHHCDNPPCCNPRHLFAAPHRANIDDMRTKGRNAAPPGGWNRKLTDEQQAEILARYEPGVTRQDDLAAEYGVGQTVISRIVRPKSKGRGRWGKGPGHYKRQRAYV